MGRVCKIVALAAIASSAAGPLAARAGAAGGSTFIRVNQVGYPTTAPKRAYLMSHREETGTTFTVQSTNGEIALTGTVGPSLGSWRTGEPR
jgi:hypothetical protein